jgi:periplasmic divalent cation tolerance protein
MWQSKTRDCFTNVRNDSLEFKMKSYIQISTTTATREDAQKIARYLVEQKLAACAQILGPIESTYTWKSQIETANEWLCLIKTRENLFGKAEAAIKKLHPYETPEIIAVPIKQGSAQYLQWIEDSLI